MQGQDQKRRDRGSPIGRRGGGGLGTGAAYRREGGVRKDLGTGAT